MNIYATEYLRVVPNDHEPTPAGEGAAGVPPAMDPFEAAEVYARHADELAASAERLQEANRRQGREIQALSAALGELHTVLDELAHALSGGDR